MIQLEKLPSALVASERAWKGVGFPRDLRVEALDECIKIMRIPSGEDFPDDVQVILSRHNVLLLTSGLS